MSPQVVLIWVAMIFALAIMGALLLYVMTIFFDNTAPTSGIFTNNSYAANFTSRMTEGVYNVSAQAPNAGKLAGVLLILGVVALMGFAGYMGYKKFN